MKGDKISEFDQVLVHHGEEVVKLREATWNSTLLMSAAEYDKLHCAEELVKWGANVHDVDRYGDTVLHYASYCGSDQVARWLLQQTTSNPQLKNKYAFNSVDVAKRNNRKSTVEILLKQ